MLANVSNTTTMRARISAQKIMNTQGAALRRGCWIGVDGVFFVVLMAPTISRFEMKPHALTNLAQYTLMTPFAQHLLHARDITFAVCIFGEWRQEPKRVACAGALCHPREMLYRLDQCVDRVRY